MTELKNSGPGIASFVVGVVAAILIIVVIAAAGVLETSTPGGVDREAIAALVVGLLVIALLLTALVGLGLGIGGLLQKQRKKVFAVAGTVISALTVAGTLAMILLGLSMA